MTTVAESNEVGPKARGVYASFREGIGILQCMQTEL